MREIYVTKILQKICLHWDMRQTVDDFRYIMSSGNTWLMKGQKDEALIRGSVFCGEFDQSWLSDLSIYRKHFSPPLHNLRYCL